MKLLKELILPFFLGTWKEVDELTLKIEAQVKGECVNLSDLMKQKTTGEFAQQLQKLNNAKTQQIRQETLLVQSKKYEVALESAPQAIIQIYSALTTGILTTTMVIGK